MRLKDKFKELKKEGKKAFIAYVPFGFPSVKSTKNICLALQDSGVDIIELGIPFSDPLADGPIIQNATTVALRKGANTENFFKELVKIESSLKIPIVIMSYYNPIFKFGLGRFLRRIKKIGIDAITIVDLPLEESNDYIREARSLNIDTIFFITPTTSKKRIRKIANQSKGFIYYIPVTGITGPKSFNYSKLSSDVKAIKKVTATSVCVGFGIHSKDQIERINKFSDGVIIGSSIVKFTKNNHKNKKFLSNLKRYIKSLK